MFNIENSSIRKNLILIQLATAFMAVLICCVFFVYNDIRIYKETSVKTKQSIAEIVGMSTAPALGFLDRDAAKQMLLKLKSNPTILNAVILDKEGKEFARYNKAGEEAFSFPATGAQTVDQSDMGQRILVSYKIHDPDFLGTVILRAELSGFTESVLNYVKIAAFILVVSLVAAFLISTFLQRDITNRLLAFVAKTQEVSGTNDFSIRLPTTGKDEISTLSAAFNNMLGQIEKMQGVLKQNNVQLERRVRQRTAELEAANKELERFVYVASHDLQEPLRTITNYTGLIEKGYAAQLDEKGNRYLASTLKATARMRVLIKDLLELSRIGKDARFTQVDTGEILKETIGQLNAAIEESETNIIASPLPVLQGNEVELKLLFQNLISNAIKFKKKGAQPVIQISAEEKPTHYLFAFKDNGIGIEEQYKERIFIVFQRLHNKDEYAGTGIGLATCQKIVAMHKGEIWVESSPGAGSTFYFTIQKDLK